MIGIANVLSFVKDSVWNFGKKFISLENDPKAAQREIDRLFEQFRIGQEIKKSPEIENEQFYDVSNDNNVENCYKKSGYISSLNENGGTINKIWNFSKYQAGNSWTNNKLRKGVQVSFIVFEEVVRNVEVIESCWDDEVVDERQFVDKMLGSYETGTRTIIGNVVQVRDGVVSVDIGEKDPISIVLKDHHPSIGFALFVADVLNLNCLIQEDPESWNSMTNSFGKVLSVKSFSPTRFKSGIGMLSSICKNDQCYIIDDHIIASESVVKQTLSNGLEYCENYEYEAIETSVMVKGKNYDWRLTKVSRANSQEQNDPGVKLFGQCFNLYESKSEIIKFISVYNESRKSIVIRSCELTQFSSGIVRLQKTIKDQVIKPSEKYNVYLVITPSKSGSFNEFLDVDFGDFKKKTHCQIDISMKRTVAGQVARAQGELIPGQRLRRGPRFIAIRIESHPIPSDFSKYDFKKQKQLVIADLQESHYGFIFDPLEITNYIKKMEYSLYMEELEMEIHFERYQIDRGYFERAADDMFKLEVLDVAEKRPSIGLGDWINVINVDAVDSKSYNYQGYIHKVDQHHIYVKFQDSFLRECGKDFKIEFHFSRSPFRRQHHALQVVTSNRGLNFDFLFPSNNNACKNPQVDVTLVEGKMISNGENLKWINENLNIYQKQAVVNVLRGECRPLPYIIYGPPGTGKTQTVIELIAQISTQILSSRIIVATPSNSAAFLIVERLLETGKFKAGDFVRFVSYSQVEKDLIPEHLKKYCATIEISDDDGGKHTRSNSTIGAGGIREGCTKSTIVQYKILVSTLGTIGSLMNIKFPPDHFTHVIIDEAGQSVETETLIPMTLLERNRGQVILAGDPKQLGPILLSSINKLEQVGFGTSFLERLSQHPFYIKKHGESGSAEYDSRFVTKLKKNYRSIPSVLEAYNRLFYELELEAEIKDDDTTPEIQMLQKVHKVMNLPIGSDPKCGVFFCNVAGGRNARTSESTSWFNEREASCVFKLVCRLEKAGIPLSEVGIITPYALQVKKLRTFLEETMPNSGLKVGSVEEFQGQERQIIVISTVRTNHKHLTSDVTYGLGFIHCKKRMNVAISRARSAVIIYGRESMLSKDENWRTLVAIAKQNGTYINE